MPSGNFSSIISSQTLNIATIQAKLTRNKPNLRASVGSVRLVESQADLDELMTESKPVLFDFHGKW